jgi:hypothetical protein
MLLAVGWLPSAPDNRHSVARDPIDDDHWVRPKPSTALSRAAVTVTPEIE